MQKYCFPLLLIVRGTIATPTTKTASNSSSHSFSSSSASTASCASKINSTSIPSKSLFCSSTTQSAAISSSLMINTAKQYYPFSELLNSTIGYCTDVEGNYEYWKRYVRLSKVLDVTETGIKLKSNCHFIYGGDVCDRGVGDLRILKDLMDLKNNYPDRVHLILGNRDINKIRLLTELQPESYSQPGQTYWTGPIRQTDELNASNRLKAILIQTMGAPDAFEYRRQELLEMATTSSSKKDFISDEEVTQSFLDSVGPDGLITQYLAKGTLAVLLGDCLFFHGGLHDNTIGFVPPLLQDVLSEQECADDIKPSAIPPLPLLRWIEELERFKTSEMEDYRFYSSLLFSSSPSPPLSALQKIDNGPDGRERIYGAEVWSRVGGYRYPAAGGRLLQYGMGWLPDRSVNPTLIYDNYLSDGAPCPPSTAVLSYLVQGGVRRVITGHQPHGDAVVVISNESVQFLTGDTSYAKNAIWLTPPQIKEDDKAEYRSNQERLGREILTHLNQNGIKFRRESELAEEKNLEELALFSVKDSPSGDPLDTRGVAVSEIYFTFNPASSSGSIHGVLSNGLPYHFSLPNSTQKNSNLVGLTTTDGWWVKGRLTDPPLVDPHSSSAAASATGGAQGAGTATGGAGTGGTGAGRAEDDSFWSLLSSFFCGCRQNNRPITPQEATSSPQHLPPSSSSSSPSSSPSMEEEVIYLVCYSRGREVYNAFARGKELMSKGFQ